ncbi:hypothetical protein [Planctomycetes bacterium K23_9]|uniref:Nicotinic acid mononucleotide adenylyltransferase n=1 Tax=Stieleria marina TaxID=1930275 RepID=A0A517P2L1_9BACT|nr:nicotinic acid mononucleotide adenylyltransferase [Planctomycetes bacterium K23_9]
MHVTKQIWQQIADGRQPYHGDVSEQPILFPGSFNPVHQGHRQMAAIASELFDRPVYPEISLVNVDKPDLDFESLGDRVRQTQPLGRVLVTRAPRFIDKAKLFPGSTFVIGADTAIRLDQPGYYDNSLSSRDDAIDQLASLGSTFLVFGRKVEQTLHDAGELNLSASLTRLCRCVPKTRFRNDISSTQIRGAQQRHAQIRNTQI